MNRKVLITGGAGFVGSRVVKRFVDAGDSVVIFDTFRQYIVPSPDLPPPNLMLRLRDMIQKIEIVRGDTLNKDHLRRALNAFKPDVIVHMAALPLAAVAIEHTEEANTSIVDGTLNMLEIVRDFRHPCRFVYISSSMVYGDFATETVTEDAPKDPKEIYGSFKLCGELICRGYMKCYGMDISMVRPSAVYGPYDANQRVLQKFITKALAGEPLRIDGDGSMRLDFTYVDDTAQGIYRVATEPAARGEVFNITRGEARSLKDAVEVIRGEIPDVQVTFGEAPAYMPKRGTLDVGKARKLVGYKPEFDLTAGIQRYVDHLRNSPF